MYGSSCFPQKAGRYKVSSMNVLLGSHLSPTSQAVGGRWGLRFLIQLCLWLSTEQSCRDGTAFTYFLCLLLPHILFAVPILGQTYSFSYLPMSAASCLSSSLPHAIALLFSNSAFLSSISPFLHSLSCLVTDRLLLPRMHKSGISYAMPSCSKTLYILSD